MNLFEDLTPSFQERFETLLQKPGFRIERILSSGQASPEGFWYEQREEEWVVVLKGYGVVHFEDTDERVRLGVGDMLHISAGRRHRVEETAKEETTLWLAVHF